MRSMLAGADQKPPGSAIGAITAKEAVSCKTLSNGRLLIKKKLVSTKPTLIQTIQAHSGGSRISTVVREPPGEHFDNLVERHSSLGSFAEDAADYISKVMLQTRKPLA